MKFPRLLAVCCLFVLSMAGCQQSLTDRLMGEWVGTPDTAAAAAERSAQTKANAAEMGGEAAALPVDENLTKKREKTDLEQHDVTITLDFKNRTDVEMKIAGGGQPLNGRWRLVQALPPRGAEIEISLKHDASEKDGKPQSTEKRRFVIDFQGDDNDAGFTLSEKGADPQFGRLYFKRKD